jgi:ketosteroid isomerase-like protein
MRFTKVRSVLVAATAVAAVLGAVRAADPQTDADRRAAEGAMLKADRDFNQAAVERNLERFLSFVADDATFESAEGRGRESVAKAWAPFFDPNGPTITWTPLKAEALVAADVGYTVGRWQRSRTVDGKTTKGQGQYLTVWRKQKDGSWKAIFDTGSTVPVASTR